MLKSMISKAIWTCVYACSAPAVIWTDVYVHSKAGGVLKAIWTYVYACLSVGERMELRLCMFERWWRYGLASLHIAAPAAVWTYVYVYSSTTGDLENADVAVARVSCVLRGLRR